MYKHYSFDLWLTLIRSNPGFRPARAKYFHEHFNVNKLSLEAVDNIIKEVDVMCNYSNEMTGRAIDSFEMYSMVMCKLGYSITNLSLRDIQAVYHAIDSIIEKFPPMLYDSNTLSTLRRLREQGCTLSILSNTGYIKGASLAKVLSDIGIHHEMSFTIFSDQLGASKPDQNVFLNMVNAVHAIRRSNPITQAQIVHVGDNPHADIQGALKAGVSAIQINSNNKTIKDLLV